MKQDYTIAELQAEIAALQQLFDCVTLADPCRGLLDPATLQPLDKVAEVPALDANGRGMRIIKAASGLETLLAQGIRVEGTPCVLMMQMPLPRGLNTDGDEDAFTRALSQMQEDLRRDHVTGVYNAVYLNEEFRPHAERAAMDGQPVGVVMLRVKHHKINKTRRQPHDQNTRRRKNNENLFLIICFILHIKTLQKIFL